MSKKNTHVVPFARKREGLTDYRKRLKLLISRKPRLVIRKSLRNIIAQIVEYNQKGDKVVVSVSSISLAKFGWKMTKNNLPAAYLTGLLLGKKAKKAGVKEAVLDMGMQKSVKGSKIYAALKGVLDSGLDIPHSDSMLPSESRIKGEHIAKYASELSKKETEYKKKFGEYIKNGVDPTKITHLFEEAKKKVLGA